MLKSIRAAEVRQKRLSLKPTCSVRLKYGFEKSHYYAQLPCDNGNRFGTLIRRRTGDVHG